MKTNKLIRFFGLSLGFSSFVIIQFFGFIDRFLTDSLFKIQILNEN
jgi:hypothetical protein